MASSSASAGALEPAKKKEDAATEGEGDDDPEAVPPTQQEVSSQRRESTGSAAANLLERTKKSLRGYLSQQEKIEDCMTYHTNDLASWACLTRLSFTVWGRPSLWHATLRLFILSSVVCVGTVLVVHDYGALQIGKFTEISKFLNIFVGLLLGFFMSASVNRWWRCADGFLQLFDAIRNLQMQLYALGVVEDKINRCIRYGVLSAWILNMQLHTDALGDKKHKEAATHAMWEDLATDSTGTEGLDRTFAGIQDAERRLLQKMHDPAGLLWMWVGSYLGRMAQDGDVPAMASPTYGRLMNLAQNAHAGIRQVRSSVSVQAPYIYVQMLAALVHINNIFNALSFGMTWGVSVGTYGVAHKWLGAYHPNLDPDVTATVREGDRDAQSLLVSFFFSCFGPFIYQALLEVSICIAQPFSNTDGEIPTWRLLMALEQDLHDGKFMAVNPPSWKPPCFKKTQA